MDKTETKTVYSYDSTGLLIGAHTLDYTDRSPISGRWQIPGNTTLIAPGAGKEGYDRYWTGTAWEYREIPKAVEPEKPATPVDTTPVITLESRVKALEDAMNTTLMGA